VNVNEKERYIGPNTAQKLCSHEEIVWVETNMACKDFFPDNYRDRFLSFEKMKEDVL
jgi:hypothetical protein